MVKIIRCTFCKRPIRNLGKIIRINKKPYHLGCGFVKFRKMQGIKKK